MISNGCAADNAPADDAAAWYLANELREGEVDQDTARRWAEWYEQPENRAEYNSLADFGQLSGSMPRPAEPSDDELKSDFGGISRCAEQSSAWLTAPLLRIRSIPTRIPMFASAAGLLLSLALAGWLILTHGQRPVAAMVYATAAGEQRAFTLEDGSLMTLGGNTAVEVRFGPSGRIVVLSHGEGMFRVRHETDRPFSVCTASGCTTAVGTVFDVRLYSNHTRVWVQEGAVMVTAQKANKATPESTTRQPVRLGQWQAVTYDSSGRSGTPTTIDPLTATGWTRGSLVYFGRPLGEVLEDVQRYTSRRLNVDAHDALLLYSGSVLQQHIDEWIRGLPHVFPVQVVDCHNLQESLGTEIEDVTRACASDPDRILIRPR